MRHKRIRSRAMRLEQMMQQLPTLRDIYLAASANLQAPEPMGRVWYGASGAVVAARVRFRDAQGRTNTHSLKIG